MTITPTAAARAYQTLAGIDTKALGLSDPGDADGRFAGLLSSALRSFVDKGREAETQSAALMTGKTDMVDVVTAVAETEIAMETLVTLRNRVISAYEEIMRMPI